MSEKAPRHERVHDQDSLDVLGRVFRTANRYMVLLWRLGFGRWAEAWPAVGGRMLVVEHRGRTSGRSYRTPLNFTPGPDCVYCVAAFGPGADWYRNSMAATDVTLWLPSGAWRARALDVSDDEKRMRLIRSVLIDSGLAAPAFGVDPRRLSDDELAGATAAYRLVRFDLAGKSDDRPADLAWVWVPTALVGGLLGLLLVLAPRRRRGG